jgi:Mg-chelatase subunit ChlD
MKDDLNIKEFDQLPERLKKWRLVLGKGADPQGDSSLEGEAKGMDDTLESLYDNDRQGGLGNSSPNINRWLGDIRKYFPTSMVQIMQKDAMERLGLKEMLLEPEMLESVEPDVDLVGTLLSLNKIMPNKTRETARKVVRKVVLEVEKRLTNKMREAIEGALNRSVRNRRPKLNEMDWHRTIRANMKHYQKEYKTIIPEQLWGYGRKGQSLKHVILLVDQSGSMASSLVYAGVFGAVMASLRSVKTHMVVFDTSVVDLTDELTDPVELLFGTQLGGGTDINKALTYAEQIITQPDDTILILISDLYEGGNEREMLRRAGSIKSKGVSFITLLALADEGAPAYDKGIAQKFYSLDIPTFACTPDKFPDLMAAAMKKEDITSWMSRNNIVSK